MQDLKPAESVGHGVHVDCIAGHDVCEAPVVGKRTARCSCGHRRSGPVCFEHATRKLTCRVCYDAGHSCLLVGSL